jgi:gamma-polyglutamate biosynthesis protein CapA
MKKIDKIFALSIILLAITQTYFFYSFSSQKDYQISSVQMPARITTSSVIVLEKSAEKKEDLKPKTNTEKNFSALFFGDMMLDRYVAEKIKIKKISGLISDIAGEENRFLRGADLVSANLEGAVTNMGAHYAPVLVNDFAFAPDTIREVKKYGFDFFNIANNHLSDQGKKGMNETRKNLDDIGADYSGCTDREIGACSAKILYFASTSVAMIGLSSVYGTFDSEKVSEIIRKAKADADLVVVNIHWGQEYIHEFSKTQSVLAHQVIDAGADIIIGHHPHVIQGLEIYKDRLIFYSLGNFIFDQYFSPDTQEGLAVGLIVKGNELTTNLFPIVSRQSKPSLAVGEQKNKILSNMAVWSKVNPGAKQMIKEGMINVQIEEDAN